VGFQPPPAAEEGRVRVFVHKGATYRVRCDGKSSYDVITRAIVTQRAALESYIRRHPEFQTSLTPVALLPDAPEIARDMARAADRVGVGPMAAVAGAMAEWAARAALRAGAREVLIDNGGDVFLVAARPVDVGLYTGTPALSHRLAFRVPPEQTPLALCSSSGRMGHSLSLGDCDLATVVARNAALADAAATRAANLVKTPADIDAALDIIASIPGIDGVLIVKGDRVGLTGRLPELVGRHAEPTA
jgi:ApbE superfamily uncharacterized protein (UPF0280 family)